MESAAVSYDDPEERMFQEQRAKIAGDVRNWMKEDFGDIAPIMLSPK